MTRLAGFLSVSRRARLPNPSGWSPVLLIPVSPVKPECKILKIFLSHIQNIKYIFIQAGPEMRGSPPWNRPSLLVLGHLKNIIRQSIFGSKLQIKNRAVKKLS